MLNSNLKGYHFVLASASPRRQQFFKDLGYDFSIRVMEVDEVYPLELKREKITDFLANLKADIHRNSIADNEIVITSDTIVWLNNEALGKPKNADDAVKMLKKLSNATHEVITSVCFLTSKSCETIFDVTEVSFNELSDEMIEYYIKNYQPFDKAGSYGIQEWLGFVGVRMIKGSYTNVMGLPTDKVFNYLNNKVF